MPKTVATTADPESEEVELLFPSMTRSRMQELGLGNGDFRELGMEMKPTLIPVNKLQNWFKGFKIESIDLWVEGAVKSGNLTRLVVSVDGKAGCKVVFKPKA
jgi:hypothetical protein